ncbi:hypothetical protein C5Q97_01950 [Victivallales bacterium CCUG 44730]|nr:hypothetical protein C5Q97_01950 [Victivallales bacterium CCUG 44730]
MLIVRMRTANDIRQWKIQTIFIDTILQFRSARIGAFGTDTLFILMTENLLIDLATFPVTSMKCECITAQFSQHIGIALTIGDLFRHQPEATIHRSMSGDK